MAIVIKPYQDYIYGSPSDTQRIAILTKLLESIGLTDVNFKSRDDYSFPCSFKFPDGTQVNQAKIDDDSSGFTIVYDLEAHIIVFLSSAFRGERPSPDLYIYNYIGMCVLPTSSGDVIEVRYRAGSTSRRTCEMFNIPRFPDYSDTNNPDNVRLLPAHVGIKNKLYEIPNCYVALNATYITGTKLVDETGAKWVSLIGPLLYKVPTIE